MSDSTLNSSINNQLTTGTILQILNNISKNVIPDEVVKFIKSNTTYYNRSKLVNYNDYAIIESSDLCTFCIMIRNSENVVKILKDKIKELD